jgi:2-polyprenyl-6-methoxyphenol hydroxylase-like FAD-dependent oxidoreductase
LKRGDGKRETCEAAYIAGCDGTRSSVREALGIGFPGGIYAHLFYVADVEASGAAMNGEPPVALDATGFLAVSPLKGERRARLIGTLREEAERQHETLSWDHHAEAGRNTGRLKSERTMVVYQVLIRDGKRRSAGKANDWPSWRGNVSSGSSTP